MDAPDSLAALAGWLWSFIAHVTTYRGLAASVLDAARDPEAELSASCQGMRDAAAKLLSRAQDDAAIRPDLTVAELLCVTNGIAVAAEQRPQDTPRLLSLLIEGLQQHA
ncbi:hypothetical protein [Actinomadura sp. NPDC048394]|uniref:SbtR family transcriptional regulator n=1 Tax=Actinomadura sp. NPDC048394 TaxID=3158223 RepID=UPI003410E668